MEGSSVAALSVTLRKVGVPFQRGFFCDDQSLMHPVSLGTISAAVLYSISFGLPSACMIAIESFLVYSVYRNSEARHSGVRADSRSLLFVQLFRHSLGQLVPFFFGAAVTHLTTNIPKYSVGRLRPHFMTVCEPDWSKINCTVSENLRYITEDVCLGTDAAAINEARLSFPSGHASAAIYSMVYLMIYLQFRLTWSGVPLLRPTLQTSAFYLALYTCLSRISDYKHHWSDVLAGAVLGLVVAATVIVKVSPLYKNRLNKECPLRVGTKEEIKDEIAENTYF